MSLRIFIHFALRMVLDSCSDTSDDLRNWASGPCVLDDRPVVGQYVLLLVQKSRFWA